MNKGDSILHKLLKLRENHMGENAMEIAMFEAIIHILEELGATVTEESTFFEVRRDTDIHLTIKNADDWHHVSQSAANRLRMRGPEPYQVYEVRLIVEDWSPHPIEQPQEGGDASTES